MHDTHTHTHTHTHCDTNAQVCAHTHTLSHTHTHAHTPTHSSLLTHTGCHKCIHTHECDQTTALTISFGAFAVSLGRSLFESDGIDLLLSLYQGVAVRQQRLPLIAAVGRQAACQVLVKVVQTVKHTCKTINIFLNTLALIRDLTS